MTYAEHIAAATSHAIEQGIAPAEIIQVLELVKLEVAHQMFEAARAAQAAAENGPKIHLPGN